MGQCPGKNPLKRIVNLVKRMDPRIRIKQLYCISTVSHFLALRSMSLSNCVQINSFRRTRQTCRIVWPPPEVLSGILVNLSDREIPKIYLIRFRKKRHCILGRGKGTLRRDNQRQFY